MKFWENILKNSEKSEGNNLEKWYYKIIDPNDSETEFYVSVDLPIKEEKVCSFLGLDGFSAKMIPKDEYEQNTDDET